MSPDRIILDGFSPNLNKRLHIGHLRNLAMAGFLQRALDAKLTAMLGVSLGEHPEARTELFRWLTRAGITQYQYITDSDVWELQKDELGVTLESRDGAQYLQGTEVVIIRSDGRPTYAGHELAFKAHSNPDYYLTGAEQAEHFKSLGLGTYHLPLGLVLDEHGQKLRSRDGSAPLAENLFQSVRSCVKGDETIKDKLAWNIIALAMLTPTREMPVRMNLQHLCTNKAAGLWVTYSRARLHSALGEMVVVEPALSKTFPNCPAFFTSKLMEACSEIGLLCDRKAPHIRGGSEELRTQARRLLAKTDGLMTVLGLHIMDRV